MYPLEILKQMLRDKGITHHDVSVIVDDTLFLEITFSKNFSTHTLFETLPIQFNPFIILDKIQRTIYESQSA